jgi:hypothetical protein
MNFDHFQLSIPEFETQEDGHIVYVISVNSITAGIWTVKKRYSEFDKLNLQLLQGEYDGQWKLNGLLESFPSKEWGLGLSPSQLDTRRIKLQAFLLDLHKFASPSTPQLQNDQLRKMVAEFLNVPSVGKRGGTRSPSHAVESSPDESEYSMDVHVSVLGDESLPTSCWVDLLQIAEKLHRGDATLTKLSFDHQRLHPDAMGVLSRACASNLALLECNFAHCGLGPDCARLLADALKTNCSITTVQLQHNHLGPKGAGSVAGSAAPDMCLHIFLFYFLYLIFFCFFVVGWLARLQRL